MRRVWKWHGDDWGSGRAGALVRGAVFEQDVQEGLTGLAKGLA
jgi:hypothetical protein